MRIVPLTEEHKEEWDKIVYESDDAWLFNLYAWIEVQESVWGWKSYSFLISDNNRIIGICPLMLCNSKFKKYGITFARFKRLTTAWGTAEPAFIKGIEEKYRETLLKIIFDYINDLSVKLGVSFFDMSLSPLAGKNLPDRMSRVNPYVFYGLEDISTYVYLIDISPELEDLYSGMSHAFRKNIKKAQEAGVSVGKMENQKEMDEYYKVHLETYNRTGATPHPPVYFELIWKNFVKRGLANIFYAEYNGEKIDFLNVASFKNTAMFWTTCSKSRTKDLQADALVVYNVYKWAKENGYRWIQIGEVFPNAVPGSKLFGIYRYKKNMGGKLYPLYKARKVYLPFKSDLLNFGASLKNYIKSRFTNGR